MEVCCKKGGDECYGVQELKLLFEISERLISSRELNKDLTPILRLVVEHLGAERSFVTILNRKSSRIAIEAACGLSSSQQARGSYTLGEGVIGRVIELGQPVVISEISKSKLFVNKTKSELTRDGQELSFICVPLMEDNQVNGALSVIRIYNPNISYEEDVRLMSVVGSLIASVAHYQQEKLEELELLRQRNRDLKTQLDSDLQPKGMVGSSGKMRDVYGLISMVAPTASTVLIRGESGSGKELIAESIHSNSQRDKGPMIKVNCSALPDSLIESELFGHEKGAFTGADQKRTGRFELAHNGTIFLDEIGDLPQATQVKILRILQEREFERLGGTETIHVDVRIIAATNRNLEELIESGEFREDLFYRINVFPVYLPPLRDRREDIPLLVDHFIEKFNKRNDANIKRITTTALNMLMVYSWPGNIRELENCIERACILSRDGVIHSYQLPPTLQTADSTNTKSGGGLMDSVERIEKQLIIEALTSTGGNITRAAIQLKVTERMLGTRIKKYGIDVWRFKQVG
ncbi:sigma-54 interaction domain-containing protein [Marinilabilia rubra]|uniref:Sigma-54-dependent Fis family transcriptional regulator n=1 Tax=Marinilabilia rubra TaxID=2162893 RepID=A0A2U2BBX2_9BACT|nr:sigma 54-interacting transcriptional regulator [Marinilabilia rubra]PWE00572.1 sigma-54-dependent Fis family transcriptional regulator [Marinilabilia rubra]